MRLVAFKDKAGDWVVLEDVCPHRLAPLSDGRLTEERELMCSYHGAWQGLQWGGGWGLGLQWVGVGVSVAKRAREQESEPPPLMHRPPFAYNPPP